MSQNPFPAFAYLIIASTKNRVLSGLKKLKKPRYLIGTLVMLAYIYWMFFNPMRNAFGAIRPTSDGMIPAQGFIMVLAFFQIFVAWLQAPFGQGIVFSEAEVQRLFPAPLTRKQLLFFRWLREQPIMIILQLFFAGVAVRMGAKDYILAALSLYAMNNVLSAHATIARLVGLWLRGKGTIGKYVAFVPMFLIVGVVGWAIWDAVAASGPDPFFVNGRRRAMSEILKSGPVFRTISTPLFLLTAPVVGTLSLVWARDFALVCLLFSMLRILLFNLDVAFEEQSAALASKLSRVKTEGLAALAAEKKFVVKATDKPLFELSSTGAPWVAFVWKNVISIGRFKRAFMILPMITVMAVVVATNIFNRHGHSQDIRALIGMALLAIVPYSTLIGPSLLRIDLRLDLAHFDVLKAMPLRGRQLILGEVLATTFVLWGVQILMMLTAFGLLWKSGVPWPNEAKRLMPSLGLCASILVGGGVLLGAIDFAITTAQNLMALFFPSFTRVGTATRQGFDAFGQQLIGSLLTFVGYFVLFILPGVVATLAAIGGQYLFGLNGLILCGGLAGGLGLIVEAAVLILASERRFDTYDLTAESVGTE